MNEKVWKIYEIENFPLQFIIELTVYGLKWLKTKDKKLHNILLKNFVTMYDNIGVRKKIVSLECICPKFLTLMHP